ncbi:MAG: sel1 repeat family protein [Bacilli bacterium]|nr:sel1 repeat family protein [Bacilli bacterium]
MSNFVHFDNKSSDYRECGDKIIGTLNANGINITGTFSKLSNGDIVYIDGEDYLTDNGWQTFENGKFSRDYVDDYEVQGSSILASAICFPIYLTGKLLSIPLHLFAKHLENMATIRSRFLYLSKYDFKWFISYQKHPNNNLLDILPENQNLQNAFKYLTFPDANPGSNLIYQKVGKYKIHPEELSWNGADKNYLDGVVLYDDGDYVNAYNKFVFAWKVCGHPLAGYYLGYMFEYGLGVKVNYKNALFYYDNSAKRGSFWSMISMGRIYRNSFHGTVKINYVYSEFWFNRAILYGSRDTATELRSLLQEKDNLEPGDFVCFNTNVGSIKIGTLAVITDVGKRKIAVSIPGHKEVIVTRENIQLMYKK